MSTAKLTRSGAGHSSGVVNVQLADSFSVHEHIKCVLHGAGGGDFSGIDEENFIRISNRVEAMRDDDFRGRRRQPIEYLPELLLGTVSMFAVASSRIKISGSRNTARMKAMICF